MSRKKEIEKAAKEITQDIEDWEVAEDIEDAFIEGAEWADSHPHWISVEDDLPKEDVFVQVVCDGYVSIARRHENRWQLGFGTKTADYLIYTPYNDKITHWMPKPSPPEHIADVSKKISSSEIPNNQKGGKGC